ncbi:MAG TPA: hypothetical protein VGI46_22450 [Candidatus Acidoferrum sp.]
MPSPRELTRKDILTAARTFRSLRKLPKWTVIVDDRELPARPLVIEAAGVPPNDPTNSHQAIAILESLGFETRYAGEPGRRRQTSELPEERVGTGSIFDAISEIRESVPDDDWKKLPTDLSKNVDHYLYGTKKSRE